MAEYYAVLSKAVAGLTESAESRRKVYDKARNALIGQLKAINPPLPTAEISRQRLELEEAIRRVERESASAAITASPPAPQPQPERARNEPESAVPAATAPEDVFRRAIDRAQPAPRDRGAPPPHHDAGMSPDQFDTEYPAPQNPAYGHDQPPVQPEYHAPEPAPYQPPPPQSRQGARRMAPENASPPQDFDRVSDRDDRFMRQQPEPSQDFAFEWDAGDAPRAEPAPDPFVDERNRPKGRKKGRRRRADTIDHEIARRPQRRSRLPAILLTLLLLVVLGGLGALGWSQRDIIVDILASFDQSDPPVATPLQTSQPAEGGLSEPEKLGDRLGVDNNVRQVGPQPDDLPVVADGGDLSALVAQQATLYEEPIDSAAQGAGVVAIDADVRWSYLASGANGPEVVADLSIPDRNLNIRMSIRKNVDETLPASHLVEVVSQGAIVRIAQVPRLVFKATEAGRGQPLVGAAAKVADGLFWIALSSNPNDVTFNEGLIRDRDWIDLPIVYESGQRAILTFEKGTPGQGVIQQAIAAWSG